MKNKTKAIIGAAVLLLLLVMLRFWRYSSAWGLCSATLHYERKGVNITVELEREDWVAISRMFNFKLYEENYYGCPVSDRFSITAGATTYYIAGDGCDLIHVPGRDKCFMVGEDIKELKEILNKYGVEY